MDIQKHISLSVYKGFDILFYRNKMATENLELFCEVRTQFFLPNVSKGFFCKDTKQGDHILKSAKDTHPLEFIVAFFHMLVWKLCI